jgi:isochorismate synthase
MSTFGLKNIQEVGPEETTMGDLKHLATRLSGTLPKVDVETGLRLARHMHPTPAIGGTPTETALSFINEKEQQKRGYYAGFMGLLEPEAVRLRLYVNLRCASLASDAHWIFAGAGITALSIPQDEARETERKADLIRPFLTSRPKFEPKWNEG